LLILAQRFKTSRGESGSISVAPVGAEQLAHRLPKSNGLNTLHCSKILRAALNKDLDESATDHDLQ